MTRDDLKRLAAAAGGEYRGKWDLHQFNSSELERFARLVTADFMERNDKYLTNDASREAVIEAAVLVEREACARLADERLNQSRNHLVRSGITVVAIDIRARTQNMRIPDAHKED